MELLALTGRAEPSHFWFHGFRRFVAPVLAGLAGGRTSLRLLDCGCGTGANIALLAPHGQVFAFELTAYGAARARATHGVPIAQADITRIPLPAGSFDIVTAFDVLQMVPDDGRAVAEMAKLLKPGGAIVVTLAALQVLRGDHAESWKELRRYTPATARRLMESAGLAVERVSYTFASLFPLMLAVRVTQRMLRPFRPLRPDTDIAVPAAPVNALLTWMVSVEAALLRRVPMPVGSSLLVVARKAGPP